MHGVYFGEIHSYNDLHLILEPFTPTPATPQTNFLKIPGRDGFLDLTEANGEVKYNSREFTFSFTIAPNDNLTFDERVTEVSNALNGLSSQITLDRDPDYYWVGRCAVDKYEQNKAVGKIVVKATVDPYKLRKIVSIRGFQIGSSEVSCTVTNNGRMVVVPDIRVRSNGTKIRFNDKTYTLSAGINKIPGIRFVKGDNTVFVSGDGMIDFAWQEGDL